MKVFRLWQNISGSSFAGESASALRSTARLPPQGPGEFMMSLDWAFLAFSTVRFQNALILASAVGKSKIEMCSESGAKIWKFSIQFWPIEKSAPENFP